MLNSFAGSRLFGRRFGSGTPWVLALHGWRRDHSDFDGVLSEGIDAIALDLPGFGSAPTPEQAWGSLEYANAVAQVLEEMEPQVIVLGHSFGGRVAVHLGATHPDRVGGLVLSGAPLYPPPGDRPKLSSRFKVARRLAARGLISNDKLEAMRRRYGSDDYRAASGVMRDILVRSLSEDYGSVLSVLRCPVELVWGDNDSAAPLAVAERLEAELADSHLVVCAGAGHLTPLTVPGELRAAVERLRP